MITDQDILSQIRSGTEGRALGALYRHLPAIRRMIRYHGGGRQEADDIFQEALIIFCRKAQEDGFVLSSGIYPYLYSVCRFLWSDELKRQKRQPIVADTIEGESMDIAAVIAEESRYTLAEKIVAELGDRCRELLLLFYGGGMRLRDIAAKMGYNSEQTAKNQKYKCLERARNKYQQERASFTHL